MRIKKKFLNPQSFRQHSQSIFHPINLMITRLIHKIKDFDKFEHQSFNGIPKQNQLYHFTWHSRVSLSIARCYPNRHTSFLFTLFTLSNKPSHLSKLLNSAYTHVYSMEFFIYMYEYEKERKKKKNKEQDGISKKNIYMYVRLLASASFERCGLSMCCKVAIFISGPFYISIQHPQYTSFTVLYW